MQDKDRTGDEKPQKPDSTPKDDSTPAAGPHARKELTTPIATPGSGMLPDEQGGEGSGISS